MSAQFHPTEEMLLAYGAGSLDEATALMVATHAWFCPVCRDAVLAVESLGGALLDDLPPDPLRESGLEDLLRKLDGLPIDAPAEKPPATGLPEPLRSYLSPDPTAIRWHWIAPGFQQTLVLKSPQARVRLLRIAGGRSMPRHHHAGLEVTLVLEGGYSDENGAYEAGDFTVADQDVAHQQVAAAEGCVCLILSVAPIQLHGRLGRLLNPFLPF